MEKRYFISKQGRQAGPFTKDELRAQQLGPHTPVWHEERFAWVDAGTVEELVDLFQGPPGIFPMVKRSFWVWLVARRKPRAI